MPSSSDPSTPSSRSNPVVARFEPTFGLELARLMRLRRDVRRFRRTPIPEPLLRELLTAAHLAPSVGLSQPWRLVLVDSAECRQAVQAEFARCNGLALATYAPEEASSYAALKLAGLVEAPVHLLVCCEREPATGKRLGRMTQPQTVRDSVVCAIQNLWLAARARDIGIGWVSILEPTRLRSPLSIPEHWDWVAYLCLGYPIDEDDTPELERANWERRVPLDRCLHRR